MKNRFSFEYKIAGIIIVVISLVTLIGFYAYQRFSNIVSTMGEAVRPDMHLVTAKGLLNDLSDAENNVKTYSLTKDPIYLNKIGEIYEEVQLKLSALNEIQTALDEKIEGIDSLSYFVESKFEILNQLLSLQSGFRVDEALKKVSTKIEEAPTVEDTLLVPLERTKRALLKKNRTELDTVFAVVNRIDVEDVNRGIQHVGTEEKDINRQLVKQELALIEKDRFISLKIRAVLKNIEVFEKAKIKKETEYATLAVKSTNRQIALFSITIAILLILLIAIIINYVRYNNRYRALLKDARLQSESLARTKAKFVATMSHEIRTPMNAVIGFTEQLSKSELSKPQREQLNIVRKSSDHILSLINEVLDLSKLQQQKITLATHLFQPEKVFEEVIELFTEQATQNSLQLHLQIDDKVPEYILGDAFRLKQILINLIGNALKFTPKDGRVKVLVKAEPKAKDIIQLKFQVSDTGIGMSPEKLKVIFNEFEQGAEEIAQEYGGSGLGLAITKNLIDLHGGQILVESKLNEGTTIAVEIPYQAGHQEEVFHAESPQKRSFNLVGYTLLIADDEIFNRKLLTTILHNNGADVLSATNGLEVIQIVKDHKVDLILLDLQMPELNGKETAKWLKNKEEYCTIPLIGLTASSEREISEMNIVEMENILPKPFKEQELLSEIQFFLPPRDHERDVVYEKNAIDFSNMKDISAGNDDFYVDMLKTFHQSITEGVVAIERAIEGPDIDQIKRISHRIAPACKHFSADKLYNLLKKLELFNGNTTDVLTLFASFKDEVNEVVQATENELSEYAK